MRTNRVSVLSVLVVTVTILALVFTLTPKVHAIGRVGVGGYWVHSSPTIDYLVRGRFGRVGFYGGYGFGWVGWSGYDEEEGRFINESDYWVIALGLTLYLTDRLFLGGMLLSDTNQSRYGDSEPIRNTQYKADIFLGKEIPIGPSTALGRWMMFLQGGIRKGLYLPLDTPPFFFSFSTFVAMALVYDFTFGGRDEVLR